MREKNTIIKTNKTKAVAIVKDQKIDVIEDGKRTEQDANFKYLRVIEKLKKKTTSPLEVHHQLFKQDDQNYKL